MLLRQALLNWVTASQLGGLWNMPELIAPKHKPKNGIRTYSTRLLWTCFGLSWQVSSSSKGLCVRTNDCWGICSYLDLPFDLICVCVCLHKVLLFSVCVCVHVCVQLTDTFRICRILCSWDSPLLLSSKNDGFKNLSPMIIIDWLASP